MTAPDLVSIGPSPAPPAPFAATAPADPSLSAPAPNLSPIAQTPHSPEPTHAPTATLTPADHPTALAPLPLSAATAAPSPIPEPSPPTSAASAEAEALSLIKIGLSHTDSGKYDSAEIAFYQVIKNPATTLANTKSGILGLARMHRKQGALTKAAAIYERYLKDYPGDDRTPDALLELGRTLRALGVYKSAITRFYAVINSTLKLPSQGFEHYQVLTKTAQFEIAETHFESGDFAEAAKFYNRLSLLDLAPDDRARAHFKAGCSTRLKGDLLGAVAKFRAFIEQSPDDENIPEARYLLAVTLRDLKRPEEALAATLELLRTEQANLTQAPKRWAYWQRRTGNQLANDFFESGNILNAQAIYTGLIDLSPEPTWRLPLSYQIGLCYERLGAHDRARTAYQTVVDTLTKTPSPELPELAHMAAWRIEHLGWREGVEKKVTAFFSGDSAPPHPLAALTTSPTSTPKYLALPSAPSSAPSANLSPRASAPPLTNPPPFPAAPTFPPRSSPSSAATLSSNPSSAATLSSSPPKPNPP